LKSNPFFTGTICLIVFLGVPSTIIARLASQISETTIRTRSGLISGSIEHGVLVFKGIPFAQPPVGVLRWRPPQPVKQWKGARSATAWGPICMQERKVDPGIGIGEISEDCLTLNVFEPYGTKTAHPVMVFFHGAGSPKGPQVQHSLTVPTWPNKELSSSLATTDLGDLGSSLILP